MPNENDPISTERLIAEVAARHKIFLKPDDPAFALVTINRLILDDAMERVRQVEELREQVVVLRSRPTVQQQYARRTLGAVRTPVERDVGRAREPAAPRSRNRHLQTTPLTMVPLLVRMFPGRLCYAHAPDGTSSTPIRPAATTPAWIIHLPSPATSRASSGC